MAHCGHFKVSNDCNFNEFLGLSLLSSLPRSPYDTEIAVLKIKNGREKWKVVVMMLMMMAALASRDDI